MVDYLYLAFDKFLKLQVNFNKDMCIDIFKNDAEHLFQKWLYCNYNIIEFINRLDDNNKHIILSWALQNL
jgi:hypothetical protein